MRFCRTNLACAGERGFFYGIVEKTTAADPILVQWQRKVSQGASCLAERRTTKPNELHRTVAVKGTN